MVGECTDSYQTRDRPDGGLEIVIQVPRRFRDLWLVKLTDLTVTDDEIAEYEPDHPHEGAE